MTRDPNDPKGLVREAYKIDRITSGECRSIFLDWALSLQDIADHKAPIEALLLKYRPEFAVHPMTQVLEEGLATAGPPKRRGGWRSRSR